jgi:hypothetical protein
VRHHDGWGEPSRDVGAIKGPRERTGNPKPFSALVGGCVPQLPTPGFEVTVSQLLKKNGAQVKTVI